MNPNVHCAMFMPVRALVPALNIDLFSVGLICIFLKYC